MNNENNLNEQIQSTPNPSIATNNNVTPNPSVATNNNVSSNPSVATNNNVSSNPSVATNNNVSSNPSLATNNNVTPNPSIATNNNVSSNPSVATNNNVTPNPSVATNNNVSSNPSVATNNNVSSNPSISTNNNVTPNPSVIINTSTEDNELLKAFIGNNYEKIIKNQFNFPALFLGSIYLVYRKMYLYGIIIFILNLIISNVIKGYIAYPISLTLFILIGIFIDKIYIKLAKRKIEKIKNKNTGKSFEEIKNICVKKGGTSVASAVLFVILVVLVLIIVSAFALIALLDIIDDSESDTVESSVIAYVEAVEQTLITYSMENTNTYDLSNTCSVNGQQLSCSNIKNMLEVDIKGEIPTSGKVIIDKNGEVNEIENLVIGDYTCRYENNHITCE